MTRPAPHAGPRITARARALAALRALPAGSVGAPRSYPDATITEVVDGDTVKVRVDVGFCVLVDVDVRLLGINAPEKATPEGKAAKAFAAAWVAAAGGSVLLVTAKTARGTDAREKYGRWLGQVVRGDGRDLATDLVAAGQAVAWDGHGPRPVPAA